MDNLEWPHLEVFKAACRIDSQSEKDEKLYQKENSFSRRQTKSKQKALDLMVKTIRKKGITLENAIKYLNFMKIEKEMQVVEGQDEFDPQAKFEAIIKPISQQAGLNDFLSIYFNRLYNIDHAFQFSSPANTFILENNNNGKYHVALLSNETFESISFSLSRIGAMKIFFHSIHPICNKPEKYFRYCDIIVSSNLELLKSLPKNKRFVYILNNNSEDSLKPAQKRKIYKSFPNIIDFFNNYR